MRRLQLSRAICLVLLATLFASLAAAPLSAQERQKASVAVVFVNNARTTYDDEVTAKVDKWLGSKVDGLYKVIPGEPFVSKLQKAGLATISESERDDLLGVFTDEDIDYAILAELQPFIRKERFTVFSYGKDMTATMFLKILDLRNGKYLYNGKFIVRARDSTEAGLIGNKSVAFQALDSVFIQMGEVISVRLPLNPPPKVQPKKE